MEVTLDPDAEAAQVNVAVGGPVLRSLVLTHTPAETRTPGFPWEWIAALLAAMIVVLLVMLRSRRHTHPPGRHANGGEE